MSAPEHSDTYPIYTTFTAKHYNSTVIYPIISFRVRRFRLNFFPVLSETVFAYIFFVSNEDENERRTLGYGDFAIYIKKSVLSETVFAYILSVSNKNENERRTLRYGGFAL